MEHEWQPELTAFLVDTARNIPDGYELVALAVVNIENNQAALIENANRFTDSGIVEVQIRSDIFEDAARQFNAASNAEQDHQNRRGTGIQKK